MSHWCRRGESHPLLTLIGRKLFILRNARNAKNAKSPPFGYTVVTRGGSRSASTESLELQKSSCIQGPAKVKKVEPSFLIKNRLTTVSGNVGTGVSLSHKTSACNSIDTSAPSVSKWIVPVSDRIVNGVPADDSLVIKARQFQRASPYSSNIRTATQCLGRPRSHSRPCTCTRTL